MQKNFSPSELKKWVSNFTSHGELPFITTSGLIQLKELEDFIVQIKKQHADCVRVYFLRFGMDDAPTQKVTVNGQLADGCKWRSASATLTQATIALVPAKNFKHDENFVFSADDIITGQQVTTLLPGTTGEGTGLNPPSGSGISLDNA